MKLNNKGWGLGALIAGVGVVAIALLIVVIIVNNNFKELGLMSSNINDKEYDYTLLERKVEDSAVKYISKNNIDNDTFLTVTIKKLKKEKCLNNIYDLKNKNKKCTGYVIISKINNKINYETFINCDNYKTIGYDSKFDN